MRVSPHLMRASGRNQHRFALRIVSSRASMRSFCRFGVGSSSGRSSPELEPTAMLEEAIGARPAATSAAARFSDKGCWAFAAAAAARVKSCFEASERSDAFADTHYAIPPLAFPMR